MSENQNEGEVEDYITLRLVCDYQMYGDMPGLKWGEHVFSQHKEQGRIEDYNILSSVTGSFGIQFVTFTVDIRVESAKMKSAVIGEWLYDRMTGQVCELVGDTDVDVRWIGSTL